jgi:hypothetical protein
VCNRMLRVGRNVYGVCENCVRYFYSCACQRCSPIWEFKKGGAVAGHWVLFVFSANRLCTLSTLLPHPL